MRLLDILPDHRALDADLVRWIEERVAAREQARKSKDYKAADRLRGELAARDVELEDTPGGTRWRVT